MTVRRTFGSTYRLQLNGMGFAAARELVAFLAELGVESLYLSPITRARAGSTHGYDVADFAVVDPALGGHDGLDALLDEAASHKLTVLLDIVPNHMAAATDNPYFRDVLTHGQASPFAAFFDIAWTEHDGKVMLPVLGDPLAEVLAAGELRIVEEGGGPPALAYFDHRFPLDPATYDGGAVPPEAIAGIVGRQHYLLADWRQANRAINYRRFFDINELIGIRQEDPEVFRATHELVVKLVADPRVAGVRVDHVDGLRDPAGYLEMLRGALGDAPVIEIEKILERNEELRPWPVDGTSGYEFAVGVTGLFIDPDGAAAIAADASRATGDGRSFHERAVAAKRSVIGSRFPLLVSRIADRVSGVAGPVARNDVETAVTELAVQLLPYRTYRRASEPIGSEDRDLLVAAGKRASAVLSGAAAGAVGAIVAAFTAEVLDDDVSEGLALWQQLTPPATAKGVEDTAIYDPGRLLAAADVGSDPDRPATSPADFHTSMQERQRRWPMAMSALSTHDSKRSHDVRCRLATLSELPTEWASTVEVVETAMADRTTAIGPDAQERRHLYETVVGAWPLDGQVDDRFVTRIHEYMTKAGRESKRRSDWIEPDVAHETAVGDFVEVLLKGSEQGARAALADFVREVETAGATNALASVVIRAAAPGVPDVYQGDDAWFLALVDPDNRAELDAKGHESLLRGLVDPVDEDVLHDLLAQWRDGRVKQYVVRQALRTRNALPDIVTADYVPLEVVGEHAAHVVAFARRTAAHELVCVVPRLCRSIVGAGEFAVGAVWSDTAIQLRGDWRDVFSGREHTADGTMPVGSLLGTLPIALLER